MPDVQSPESEIGRELLAPDLASRLKTVVMLQGEGASFYASVWLLGVSETLARFYAGEMRMTLLLFIQPDGTLRDDSGRQIHVFEFLGKV